MISPTPCLLLVLLPLLPFQEGVRTSRPVKRLLPLPRERGVFHFLVFGDRTGGPAEGIEILEQAVREANLLDPDLVLTVGDMVQGYNARAQWLGQMKEYKDVMDRLETPWYPVAGNHDVYWGGQGGPRGQHEGDYEKHFGPLWYWFPHKNAAFFVLYSDEGDPETGRKGWNRPELNKFSEAQLAWLKESLAKVKDKDHVFLFLHHPKWLPYPGTNWNRVHDLLVEAGNVTAVFAGHIHRMRYEGKKDGIEYFALATTGGRLSRDFVDGGWLHHMNVVTVRREGIQVATIPVGSVLDPRKITEERWTEIDSLLSYRLEPLARPGLDASALVKGSYRFELGNPTSRPIEVSLGLEDPDWSSKPDHAHFEIAPGEKKVMEIGLHRGREGFEGLLLPRLGLDIAYLTETRRILVPRLSRQVPLRLLELPRRVKKANDHALLLDGRTACLSVDPRKLALPDGPFTLEAWFRGEGFPRRCGLVSKAENSGFGLFVSGGLPQFVVHLDGTYVSARGRLGLLRRRQWQHLAGVFDGREVRLYLDGNLLARQPAKGERTRIPHLLFVGADPDRTARPSSFFPGWIDEVRLSTGARYRGSSFEPSRRFLPDRKTWLLLHLDHDLGPWSPDLSGRRNHALRVGAARSAKAPD